MNKLIFTLIAIVVSSTLIAQPPEKVSYQAVVRDADNELVTNTSVGMQISVLQGTATDGTPVFVERHFPETNENGLVSLEIGSGTEISGTFDAIDWSNGPYFIKTETDLNGGSDYTITGTSQMLSVPYSLHAASADTVTGTLDEKDPEFNASAASDISEDDIDDWNTKTLSLNIFSAYVEDATFNKGFGRSSGLYMPSSGSSSFAMNFTLPDNYAPGDTVFIRMICSADATGAVELNSNAVSVANPESGFNQGASSGGGLGIKGGNSIDFEETDTPVEVMGYLVSPDESKDLQPGDAVMINYYRSSDANSGTFKIHGMQLQY